MCWQRPSPTRGHASGCSAQSGEGYSNCGHRLCLAHRQDCALCGTVVREAYTDVLEAIRDNKDRLKLAKFLKQAQKDKDADEQARAEAAALAFA